MLMLIIIQTMDVRRFYMNNELHEYWKIAVLLRNNFEKLRLVHAYMLNLKSEPGASCLAYA